MKNIYNIFVDTCCVVSPSCLKQYYQVIKCF
jgi:hypothetical protein